MGRTTDLEEQVKMLNYKFSKIQFEAQKSVSLLEDKLRYDLTYYKKNFQPVFNALELWKLRLWPQNQRIKNWRIN